MAIAGGLLMGAAAVILLSLAGRVAGVSGILWGALTEQATYLWRWLFLIGLIIGGAALFGIGWGVYGFCPGPAVTALFYGDPKTYYFVMAMIAGMWIASRLESRAQNV
ncbi:MAG: putative membrane protein YedE/YeeE [Glaciecola sp.]|jgi:uncharacterized membrane protein YedE/YeeE|uniref:YeeE/YedE family protein n=1 Tax=Congregibacter sp. TaxID=2744308 RepID=UPI0039E5BFAB